VLFDTRGEADRQFVSYDEDGGGVKVLCDESGPVLPPPVSVGGFFPIPAVVNLHTALVNRHTALMATDATSTDREMLKCDPSKDVKAARLPMKRLTRLMTTKRHPLNLKMAGKTREMSTCTANIPPVMTGPLSLIQLPH
jgi:hypothetical protein